ncbi:MAG TPA: phage late control D family protein [Pseudomonas sabulinigri]|uniref:Late control protein n=1 Tax=marine sediment metagenome TaxID=412755 RepID=A0A0F9XX86_9ZZZZ|nr:phage late control D family protein [Halopseudomonas sabulinigri]HEC50826.1 phage late control D family protein [Halopseudomonas sabulinigri]
MITRHPTPAYRLVVNGQDITPKINNRLVSLALTDNRGLEADQLSISLTDHDGLLSIPPRGAEVQLWLGWTDTGLVYKGSYTVDETEHSGAPDVLSIRARSADLLAGLTRKRERSWHSITLADIITTIAKAYSLKPVIDLVLGAIPVPHLDQADESDANLLTRLAQDHDAITTVKAGHLLLMPVGASKTASGVNLPHIRYTRADGDSHRFLQADRDAYTGVRAHYYDPNSAERLEALIGTDDNIKTLRHVYADQASALQAVRSEWQRLQRGVSTLSYTLARGRADLIPEMTYSLSGIKQPITDVVWLCSRVMHNLNDSGYTVALELENQLAEDEDLAALVETEYTGVMAWYRDKDGTQKKVIEGDQTSPLRLTHLYVSKANAERAVKREFERLKDSGL